MTNTTSLTVQGRRDRVPPGDRTFEVQVTTDPDGQVGTARMPIRPGWDTTAAWDAVEALGWVVRVASVRFYSGADGRLVGRGDMVGPGDYQVFDLDRPGNAPPPPPIVSRLVTIEELYPSRAILARRSVRRSLTGNGTEHARPTL